MDTTNKGETGNAKLLQDTVARRLPGNRWALMNRQDRGWSSSSIEFNSLIELCQDFDVRIGQQGEDRFGRYVEIKAVR